MLSAINSDLFFLLLLVYVKWKIRIYLNFKLDKAIQKMIIIIKKNEKRKTEWQKLKKFQTFWKSLNLCESKLNIKIFTFFVKFILYLPCFSFWNILGKFNKTALGFTKNIGSSTILFNRQTRTLKWTIQQQIYQVCSEVSLFSEAIYSKPRKFWIVLVI